MTLVTHQTAPQIGKNNNQQNKQDRNKTNGKKQTLYSKEKEPNLPKLFTTKHNK